MRAQLTVSLAVALSLACGGSFGELGKDPVPVPVPVPIPVPDPVVEVPVPAPEPAASDVVVAVGPFGGNDVAIVCTQAGKAVPCPTGDCAGEEGERCWAGPEIAAVGMAPLTEGTFDLPLAKAMLTPYVSEICDYSTAEIIEGDASTTARPVFTITEEDAKLAPLEALAPGATLTSAYEVDLDGKPGNEIVAELATETGNLLAVARGDGSTVTIFDNRQDPLPDGASEEEAAAHMLQASTLTWLGMTDAGNDGVLEFVLEGSGYEASWIVVMGLHGDAVGSVGCAV